MTNKKLTIEQITSLQKQYGYTKLQNMINSGLCWHMEGAIGRSAMGALESGECMLPETQKRDYYGSTVPSRHNLKEGSKGTLLNSQRFWQKVCDGEIDLSEVAEEEICMS